MSEEAVLAKRFKEATVFLKPMLGKDLKMVYVYREWNGMYESKDSVWQRLHEVVKNWKAELARKDSSNFYLDDSHPLLLEYMDGRLVVLNCFGIGFLKAGSKIEYR